jgi:hypothetical protein
LVALRTDLGLDRPRGPAAVTAKLGNLRPTAGSRKPAEVDPDEAPDRHPSEDLPFDPDPPIGVVPNAAEVDPEDDVRSERRPSR